MDIFSIIENASRAEPWKAQALCAQDFYGDLFFPEMSLFEEGDRRAMARQREAAVAVCLQCPVINECASYADRNGEEDGVWGGVDRTLKRVAERGTRCRFGHEYTEPLPQGTRSQYRKCSTCEERNAA